MVSPTKLLPRPLPGDGKSNPLDGFSGPIAPVRPRVAYFVAVGVATAGIVALPIGYLGVVGGLLYGALLLTGVFVPAALLLAATALLLLEPLLTARSFAGAGGIPVTREDEPVLYAFVDRLARLVRAPRPARIELTHLVDASIEREGGVSGDVVLRIGLPLVGGLTARQFAGVLAHELGHCSQGVATRLAVVSRAIVGWLSHVATQRHVLDRSLDKRIAAGAGLASAASRIAAAVLRAPRHLIGGLARVGLWLSRRLTRDMEFDADRYEVRVAGSALFPETCTRLHVLALASMLAAVADDGFHSPVPWSTNPTAAILTAAKRMPNHMLQQAQRAVREGETHWQDTHPSDWDRIQAAWHENAPGIYTGVGPATQLLRGFELWCEGAASLSERGGVELATAARRGMGRG